MASLVNAAPRITIYCDHRSHGGRRVEIATLVRQSSGWDEAADVVHRLKMASGRTPGQRSIAAPSFRIVEHNGERHLLWSFVCDLNPQHKQEFRKVKLDPALDGLAGAGLVEASLPFLAATIQTLARVRPEA